MCFSYKPSMKLPTALLLAIGWIIPAASAAEVTVEHIAPRIEAVTFTSTILHAEKTFCAVLPEPCHKDNGPWPVLFLFHGRGRTERSLVDDPGARETLLSAPFVTILPDGDDGWYINAPDRPADRATRFRPFPASQATNGWPRPATASSPARAATAR